MWWSDTRPTPPDGGPRAGGAPTSRGIARIAFRASLARMALAASLALALAACGYHLRAQATYAFTSIYFAAAFFPTGDTTSQLMATAGIFAVGFFMRPLGGWLFGWIADTHGRKNSMVIS